MNYYEFNGYNENRQDQDSETLTKLFNTMGNKILMDMSTLDEEYVFDVHVFYEDTLDMLIIRVHTDRPFPEHLRFNDSYREKRNKPLQTLTQNFHHNLFLRELLGMFHVVGLPKPRGGYRIQINPDDLYNNQPFSLARR